MTTLYARRYFKNARNGRPLWFKEWGSIGPLLTAKSREAATFATHQEADNVYFWLAPMKTVQAPFAALTAAQGGNDAGT